MILKAIRPSLVYHSSFDLNLTCVFSDFQICRVKYLGSGPAIVDYDAASYEGDIRNRTVPASGYIDISENYKPAVTSYSESSV